MSNGGWDKRQWESLQDVISRDGTGPFYFKTSPASNLLGTVTHDYIAYTYVNSNITEANFYVGGSGGVIVSTISYTYNASGDITGITRT
jgi:hypothetical protein